MRFPSIIKSANGSTGSGAPIQSHSHPPNPTRWRKRRRERLAGGERVTRLRAVSAGDCDRERRARQRATWRHALGCGAGRAARAEALASHAATGAANCWQECAKLVRELVLLLFFVMCVRHYFAWPPQKN